MPLRSDWSSLYCPVARTLDVVGDPWVLLIMRVALTGTRRFDEFRDRLGVADTGLSRRLQTMTEAGLLERVAYRGKQRTHAEYRLTGKGADLLPVINALTLWGERHTTPPRDDAHLEIVHVACGAASSSADTCSACGAAMDVRDTAWHRTWDKRGPVALRDPAEREAALEPELGPGLELRSG